MNSTTILGYFAGALTTFSFLAQVVKTWKSKSTHDHSLWMFLIFSAGVLCWLTYGILLANGPIIFWNTITLVLTSAILAMKIKYK